MTFRDFRGGIYRMIGAAIVLVAITWIFGNIQPKRAWAITGPIYCDKTANFTGAGTGNTLIINGAAVGSSQTLICNFTASGGAAGAATLSYGQGATCGTNNTVLALGTMTAGSLFQYGGGPWSGMSAPGPVGGAVTNVCVNNAVASDAAWVISYTQQ